jgi:flagellum-specific peptidoglycan hydrolase FlgJ
MNAQQMMFLRSVVSAAQRSMQESGVPASITIAQAILETGWGQSSLVAKARNYFGIKATRLDPYIEMPTSEYVDGKKIATRAAFRVFTSAADCFMAHGSMLSKLNRYAPAMAVKRDPEEFARQLEACGYSTSPTYAETLITLIREFDLAQYDLATA